MLTIDSTQSLEVLLGGAITTSQLPVVATYVSIPYSVNTPSGIRPITITTQTNGATAVTAVATPAASTYHLLKYLSIRNDDTVSATLTVRMLDSATPRKIVSFTLDAGDVLTYTDDEGWRVLSAAGAIKHATTSSHSLLSATHGDTTAASVSRGAIITGQGASPAWAKLAIGAAGRAIVSDGTDAAWDRVSLSDGVTGMLPTANGGTGNSTGAREVLAANRTYYVRTDGSDSNTGLVDSAGGAKLTINAALTAAAALDCSTYNVTVQVRSGTYTAAVVLPRMIGSGTFTLIGDTTTPTNVVISVTSNQAVTASGHGCLWTVEGFKIQTTTSGYGMLSRNYATITLGKNDFGACADGHIVGYFYGAVLKTTADYTISGSAPTHALAVQFGQVNVSSGTCTLTGTPNFSSSFASANTAGCVILSGVTWSGSATGSRYNAATNSVIQTYGGGASYLPGNSAGITATGGQYA